MTKRSQLKLNGKEISLTQSQASDLADKLKGKLQRGEKLNTDPISIQQMIAGLGDPRGLIRRTFAESLGNIGPSTLPALGNALLHSSNVTVRRSAAKALKLVGDPIAIPLLLQALINDPDLVVQGSCVGALAIFGEASVNGLIEVLSDPKSTAMQCGLASWGLAFVGAEAPTALRKAAKSEHSGVRAAAIAALGDQIQTLNDKDAKLILLRAVNDPSSQVRAQAISLIGQLDDPDWANPILIEKLNDKDNQVRKNTVISLMQLKNTDAINKIKQRLADEEDLEVLAIFKVAINQLIADRDGLS